MFKNKTLLITGGTGTFGNAVLGRFLKTQVSEIRVFSRDEKKQEDMRIFYNDPKLKFYIGDVRHSLTDVGAAHTAFAYQPTVSMKEGLREYMRWAKGVL